MPGIKRVSSAGIFVVSERLSFSGNVVPYSMNRV